MPLRQDIKKVLVIGSGPIVIGQAAEFDYAGTQACRALKEEGLEVVLVNSNPATIMTDKAMADQDLYRAADPGCRQDGSSKWKSRTASSPTSADRPALPSRCSWQRRASWKPTTSSSWAPTLKPSTRRRTARCSRTPWKRSASPASPPRWSTRSRTRLAFAEEIGYPVIVRPAFTLGGTGGGIAHDEEELREIAGNGLRLSPITQVLVEKCISGWKEIEFEVIRDSQGKHHHRLLDGKRRPGRRAHRRLDRRRAGSHPGSDKEYQMLRTAALNIVRGAGRRRRLQLPVCPASRQLRVCGHRGQPACIPFLCAGFQGDRLPDREGCHQDCHRLHPG